MPLQTYLDRIADLAAHLGTDLAPNAGNVCSMTLGPNAWLHVSYSDEDDQIHWTSIVCCVAGLDASAMLRGLLAANLDWSLTRGAFFAFDDLTEVVALRCHESSGYLDKQRFIEVTERFVGCADFWRDRLARQLPGLLAQVGDAFPQPAANVPLAMFDRV